MEHHDHNDPHAGEPKPHLENRNTLLPWILGLLAAVVLVLILGRGCDHVVEGEDRTPAIHST